MERMFITEAMRGTSRLRKTAASSKKASTTMTTTNSGSLLDNTLEKSMPWAVTPPTWMASDEPAVAAGTSERMWLTSVVVWAACGL